MANKIFITGATGFIGAELLNRFVADKAVITALVRNAPLVLPGNIEHVIGDLTGLFDEFSAQTLNDQLFSLLCGVEVIVHAAARAHIMRDEIAEPLEEYRKVNRDQTLALARLAADAGVKRFLFMSTVKVNGEQTASGQVFSADDQPMPQDPYGVSKYEAEQDLLALAKETGIEVVIIRPPLVYGPGVKGNFSSMVAWVKKGIPLPLGAIRNKRSLVALDNLVDFIALCADRKRSPQAANQVFLISDGEDVSTTELLRRVARAQGKPARLIPVPMGFMKFTACLLGKGAVADRLFGNLQVDSSKARNLLGWKPVVSMEEALEKMFRDSTR
jgi:nucleoside-diphosphate-sugar epimerase